MTDIVKRLRQDLTTEPIPLHAEAADEIERLRAKLTAAETALLGMTGSDNQRIAKALLIIQQLGEKK